MSYLAQVRLEASARTATQSAQDRSFSGCRSNDESGNPEAAGGVGIVDEVLALTTCYIDALYCSTTHYLYVRRISSRKVLEASTVFTAVVIKTVRISTATEVANISMPEQLYCINRILLQ